MGRSPAGPLMHEHRIIERMLAILTKHLEAAGSTGPVDTAVIDAGIDFLRTYADRCHHGKEEDILFRELAAKEIDHEIADAMAGLIADHIYGRSLVKTLEDATRRYAEDASPARAEVISTVKALLDFYPVHIAKEDKQFFKEAFTYFNEAEQAEMLREYDEFDRALIHEKYVSLVEELEEATP